MKKKKGLRKSIKKLTAKIDSKHSAIFFLEARKKELEKLLEAENSEASTDVKYLKNQIYWINLRIENKKAELASALLGLNEKQSSSYVIATPDTLIINIEDLLNEAEADLYDNFNQLESLKEENARLKKQVEASKSDNFNQLKSLKEENARLKQKIEELKGSDFNKSQSLKEEIVQLKQRIETLNVEMRRLKNLPAKPQLHPNNPGQGKVQNGRLGSKGKKRGGSKKGVRRRSRRKLQIHQTETIPAPDNIPEGFKFMGYQDIIVQDLNFEAFNTLFRIPRFYNHKTHQTMKIPFSAKIKGHFGGKLRAVILYLKHQGRMPEKRIHTLLNEIGLEISVGQLHNILTGQDNELFHEEKKEILRAGLKSSSVIQTDDTGARHSGHNGFCNIICNELFTIYNTTQSKSRLNFLMILAENIDYYVFNEDAIMYLERIGIPKKWIELFTKGKLSFIKKDLEKFMKTHKIQGKIYQNILEAGLMGSLFENGFNPDLIIHSDGAKQFDLFVHCLCWIHAIRPINKIIPVNEHQALIIKIFLRKCWRFYKKLGKYKQNPSKALAKKLNKQFNKLFNQKTGMSQGRCHVLCSDKLANLT